MASGGDQPNAIWTTLSQIAPEPTVPAPSGADMFQSLSGAGLVGWATLGILVLFSVVSWAIIVYKAWQLRRAAATSRSFLKAFWEAKRLDQMYKDSETFEASPLCQVFRSGYVELARLKKRSGEDDLGGGIENVERALRRSRSSEVTALESHTTFLATVGSTGPFVGLFGTVWGIMKSFREIGIAGSANLATVAPGISEALIATAAGLAAAIPAVIAYNYIAARVRVIESDMDAFSSDFLNIVKRHYFK